ncbi:MAG: undecaprenyl-phosphate galactose phosphotransferase [Candidatus Magnetoglobus multicellularis str. Araruama]|uniref:Undecaprenyl-phosphate galactose phosphotransferase n=1 Tax=Candidatus Magnetoglobus multicellularis str. Araruama TaxID=890399 RepID=A0A1V1PEH0_9BACT|nr:MAG: undecaprenyl-phosphate galactose phosphotransferase [Candidatus Magnetoglobus multicellularis str. Araruama]
MDNFFKRCFDIFFSMGIIIVFAPVMWILAALIRLSMGPGVFFFQYRPGLHGKAFKMIKFRTMQYTTDTKGNPLPDKDRLTPLGQFLRKTSLDELPEFFNVLKGDMSIVGPRPLLMRYLDRYTPQQMRRHNVKPGITGWAQVHGRNAISWEKKFELDIWYVDNQTFYVDIHILLLTIKKTLLGADIHHEGCVTMEEFKG